MWGELREGERGCVLQLLYRLLHQTKQGSITSYDKTGISTLEKAFRCWEFLCDHNLQSLTLNERKAPERGRVHVCVCP